MFVCCRHAEMLGTRQAVGVKRKFDEVDGGRMALINSDPQSILNISMCKLRAPATRREPSLRRSVLIFNTLRHIESELKTQGVSLPPAGSSPIWSALPQDMDTLDPPPGADIPAEPVVSLYSPPPTPYSYQSDMVCSGFSTAYTEYSDTPRQADHLDTDSSGESSDDSNDGFPDSPGASPPYSSGSVACSSYLDLDSPSNTSALLSWTDLSYTTLGQSGQNTQLVSSACGAPSRWATSGLSAFSTTSQNTSLQDSFSDIDISMYDFDLATISPTMKLGPVSTEDLLHSFPSDSSTAYRNDLLGDDLDHIMQILVGI